MMRLDSLCKKSFLYSKEVVVTINKLRSIRVWWEKKELIQVELR